MSSTWFSKFPFTQKWIHRINQTVYGLSHWRYLTYLYHRWRLSERENGISILSDQSRSLQLIEMLRQISKNHDLYILARSSGCRIATQIADQFDIKKIICLSYPFNNPDLNIDPSRYQHLASILTPTTIIQGKQDPYGGEEILNLYSFSKCVEIFFVDADHEFNLNKNEMTWVFNHLKEALAV